MHTAPMAAQRRAIEIGRLQRRTHLRRCLAFSLAVAMALSCASGPRTRATQEPLQLELTLSDGSGLSTAALRGKPVLLFFFTTYDSASQFAFIALTSLVREREGRLSVVGVALQPNPEELLSMYAQTLSLPLALTYEPRGSLLAGQSVLGDFGGIPQYVLLAADGRVLKRHEGVLQLDALREFATADE